MACRAASRRASRPAFLRARLGDRPVDMPDVCTRYHPAVGLKVIGVRHGEVHNPGGVIYAGMAGFGLSDLGRKQAGAVGEALRGIRLSALYASPLDRAMETADRKRTRLNSRHSQKSY